MSEKRNGNKKKFKKDKPKMDSLIESDEHFGFIRETHISKTASTASSGGSELKYVS